MSKKIKIKFIGFWPDFSEENNIFVNILQKNNYQIEWSDNPDYIFCSMFGRPYEYCKYDGIRIFFSGENYTPDFNIIDYAIGFDYCTYEDRYIRYPLYLLYEAENAGNKRKFASKDILSDKTRFCDFIFGHERDDKKRKIFFDLLSEYRHVDAVGSYLNNRKNGLLIEQKNKFSFQKNCKFSIVFESVNLRGFVTEKILDAFIAQTVPIYLGDPLIEREFNEKAFINCADYNDFHEVIEKIKEIDQNDQEYIAMLQEPIFKEDNYVKRKQKELEAFIMNIVEQDKDAAFRRSMGPKLGVVYFHEKHLKLINKILKNVLFRKIYVKLVKGVESMFNK